MQKPHPVAAEAFDADEIGYQVVVEAMADALFVVDRDAEGDFRYRYVNPAYEALVSTSEAVLGQRVGAPLAPAQATRAERELREAIAVGRMLEFEHEARVGTRRLLLVKRLTPVVAPDGSCRRVIGTLTDATMRRQTERALRRSEARATAIATEQSALRRVATVVAADAEPSVVFELVAREVAAVLNLDAGYVVRFEAGQAVRIVGSWQSTGAASLRAGQRVVLDGDGATRRVLDTGRAARLADYSHSDGALSAYLAQTEFRAAVAAPVHVGGQLWGAISAAAVTAGGLPSNSESRITRFAELVGLAIANADARARLAHRAETDPLTGLANHRAFHDRLRGEMRRARRHERPLAVALLDLDYFKDVNDDHGHAAGDRVLQEATRRLSSLFRDGELLARIGGDELGLLLPETDGLGAYAVAERARVAISATPLAGYQVTLSAGVCDLAVAGSAEELVRLADGALYWAKENGRDTTWLYSPEVAQALSASERAERLARTQALAGLRALARAVDAKDSATQRHSERVAAISARLAGALGWATERIALIREAGLLHDVGKIGVPDTVLFKPGPLDESEYELVKQHSALGASIAAEVLGPEQTAWIRGHHERPDGRGYPDGLTGEAIPVGARILALADAWDVMTSPRHYKLTTPHAAAIEESQRLAGIQFAPEIVDALVALWHDGDLSFEQETPSTPATPA